MERHSKVQSAPSEGSGQRGVLGSIETGVADAFSFTKVVLDFVILAAMLALPFVGLALSDIEAALSWPFWSVVAIAYALGALALAILHRGPSFRFMPTVVRLAAHWLGVLAAVHGMFYFVRTDHLTDGQAGLVLGLLLALATFLCGVYVQWRMAIIGIALMLATIVEAVVEENLWILVGIGLLALLVVFLFQRVRARFAKPA